MSRGNAVVGKCSLQQDRNLPFNLSSQGSLRCRLSGCAVQLLFTALYITTFLAKGRSPYGNVLRAEPRAPDLSPGVVSLGADERCTGLNIVFMERDTVERQFLSDWLPAFSLPAVSHTVSTSKQLLMPMSQAFHCLSAIQGEPRKIQIK